MSIVRTESHSKLIRRAVRILEQELKDYGPRLSSPGAVRDLLKIKMHGLECEVFVVMWLNSQNLLIEYEEMFRGTITQTSVHPREVVKSALACNAAAAILAHNHPSGVAEPSESDKRLTCTLKEALALVDVRVLDHFVVGHKKITSFAERGFL